jgi:hypothetical protein
MMRRVLLATVLISAASRRLAASSIDSFDSAMSDAVLAATFGSTDSASGVVDTGTGSAMCADGISGASHAGMPCLFPFLFKGEVYTGCASGTVSNIFRENV